MYSFKRYLRKRVFPPENTCPYSQTPYGMCFDSFTHDPSQESFSLATFLSCQMLSKRDRLAVYGSDAHLFYGKLNPRQFFIIAYRNQVVGSSGSSLNAYVATYPMPNQWWLHYPTKVQTVKLGLTYQDIKDLLPLLNTLRYG